MRIKVCSPDASSDSPIFFVARLIKGVISWSVPYNSVYVFFFINLLNFQKIIKGDVPGDTGIPGKLPQVASILPMWIVT